MALLPPPHLPSTSWSLSTTQGHNAQLIIILSIFDSEGVLCMMVRIKLLAKDMASAQNKQEESCWYQPVNGNRQQALHMLQVIRW